MIPSKIAKINGLKILIPGNVCTKVAKSASPEVKVSPGPSRRTQFVPVFEKVFFCKFLYANVST